MALVRRASLREIRLAVVSAAAYQRHAHSSIGEAVNVVCDFHGFNDETDRRVIRTAVERRLRDGEQLERRPA